MKLKTMHPLWENLAHDEKSIKSPTWHKDTLKETEKRVQEGLEADRDWEDAKEELRNRGGCGNQLDMVQSLSK